MRAVTIKKDLQIRQIKDLGAFYTPSHLAYSLTETALNNYLTRHINSLTSSTYSSLEEILNTTNLSIIKILNDILEEIKILDGSVGDGEFLQACLTIILSIKEKIDQRLSNIQVFSSETPLNILSSVLYGMEINPEAVADCHRNLCMHIPKSLLSYAEKALRDNIVKGDFLESTLTTWKNLPLTVKGFDIILGNPPWGGKLSKSQREHYYNEFKLESPKRNLNTFSLFIFQAAKLLVHGGVLAYFLPKNVARSNQYTYLREFIVRNFQILSINFHGLFENVTQEFITLIGFYNNKIPSDHVILINGENYIPQTSYLTSIDHIFTKEFNSQSQRLIQLIHENSSPLAQFLTIRRGEELSKRGGVMFCPYCTEWVPLSSRRPRIICSYCQQPLSKRDLKIDFLIQKDATSHHTQPILTGDDFEAFSINSTHFINPTIKFRSKKDSSIYKSPKIVVQKIKRFPCAAYDSDNHWTTQNVYNLALVTEYTDNHNLLNYILAVLNSSLYHWFYESQFNLGSQYTNAISIRNLRRLPLRNPDFNNPLFQQIVELSRKITEEKTRNKSSPLIRELDSLVLQYYNCETIPLPVS
ncbi:MAG: Eco57I restriction-modification methylase domain-containing protein [Candidatus Hodarchaeales archaeon]|jgi:hypothetical protein